MVLNIYVDRSENHLVIETDDPQLHYYFETQSSNYEYIPWKKAYGYVNKVVKIYNPGRHSKGGMFVYKFNLGFTAFVLGVLQNKITREAYEAIMKEVILADSYRTQEFSELRDYQNQDILYLLRYKIGLFQCYTGYGKSQCLAVLTKYFHEMGKNVLLVTPNNKARDELVKRCKKLYGMTINNNDKTYDGNLDCFISAGLLHSKKVTDETLRKQFIEQLNKYDVVMADEVEYTINPSGKFIYDHCINARNFYGFSGTSDKQAGESISFINGLSDIVLRNKDMVSYFGPTLVYRMPVNRTIHNIKIQTDSMDRIPFDWDSVEKSGNAYNEIMQQIWTNDGVVKSIIKVVEAYPMCFIPLNNLNYIIKDWIENYFRGKLKTLLISSAGYTYFDLNGNVEHLDLEQACEKCKDGEVDCIPSTASGFRALDLPGLQNILIVSGKIAGVHLQSIGRVARMESFNVISLEPKSNRKIPIYSKGEAERDKLMKSYYKYCDIIDEIIQEEDL